mmetsp:Transcript_82947/g.173673  ORF Transcript_82947/g.173673 Transcript_82947/m.173673 type:complete len:200 (+) Transcript_82947:43-642(+)
MSFNTWSSPSPPSLPRLIPTEEEQTRLFRRLHHNAQARERQAKLDATNGALRRRALDDMATETRTAKEVARNAHRERLMRWGQKLSSNPLVTDLWAEDQAIFEQNVASQKAEKLRTWRRTKQQEQEARAIIEMAAAEVDEMEILRAEKRRLVQNTKNLKAVRDLEKTNARVAKVMESKRQHEMERQQKLLSKAFSSPTV